MYKRFFRLARMPFDDTADPAVFVPIAQHEEALAGLLLCVQRRRGVCMVQSEPGCGASMLGRIVARRVSTRFPVISVDHRPDDCRDLLGRVARRLGVAFTARFSTGEILEQFVASATSVCNGGGTTVLILDHVEHWDEDLLEMVGSLSGLEHHGSKLVQVVLLARNGFEHRLGAPRLCYLGQRIAFGGRVGRLSGPETVRYVTSRLASAGGDVGLFMEAAIERLYELSGGTPRVINHIADLALTSAFGASVETIDSTLIDEAAARVPAAIIEPWSGISGASPREGDWLIREGKEQASRLGRTGGAESHSVGGRGVADAAPAKKRSGDPGASKSVAREGGPPVAATENEKVTVDQPINDRGRELLEIGANAGCDAIGTAEGALGESIRRRLDALEACIGIVASAGADDPDLIGAGVGVGGPGDGRTSAGRAAVADMLAGFGSGHEAARARLAVVKSSINAS